MDEIKDAENGIDIYKLVFLGSNRQKFNFNIFKKPLNLLSTIYNGDITLKKADFLQRDLDKNIEKLKFNYKPKNVEEKEEIDKVLMHANDMFEYRDEIIEAFRNGTFLSEHLKISDDAAHDYVLEDVNNFIQKIGSMSENINLSLFEDFFESSSPADYAKMVINTKKRNENKEIVAEIEDRISDLKDRIKKWVKQKKNNKNADETLKIIKEILNYNERTRKMFPLASKVGKGKSEPKVEESIVKRTKLTICSKD